MAKTLSKLLVVDDDEDLLVIFKYCLVSLSDVEIKYAVSGEDAIRTALDFHPNLILLDVMMPRMDGISTLRVIKQLPSLSHIPVAFITAKAQEEEIIDYLNHGAIDVIVKPFDPLKLPDTILQIWNHWNERDVND